MAINPLPETSSVILATAGVGGEQVKLFALDGNTATLPGTIPAFIAADNTVLQGDLHAIVAGSKNFSTGGFTEMDMTVHSAPTTFNAANFETPGLGITTQLLLISSHAQFIGAAAPNTLIVSGSGNDTLAGLSGTNILDGGSGQNTYYGGSGANTFIADARTASASAFVENMKSGDNVIIEGNFASLAAGVTPSGLDFQVTGLTGQPSAEVILSGVTSAAGLQVGFDTNNATGVNYMFIHLA